MGKQYYIKERHNPQFKKPYYVACGLLSKRDASKAEDTAYGSNVMIPFASVEEYERAIEKYASDGFAVSNRPAHVE